MVTQRTLPLDQFNRLIIQLDLHFKVLYPLCLSYTQTHENSVSSKPQGTPRKNVLIPKSPRNKKMDSSLSPYPNEVKQVENWKPKLAPNPLQHLVPLQIFRPTYGPKILQEIPTIEVVCAHLTVYISE